MTQETISPEINENVVTSAQTLDKILSGEEEATWEEAGDAFKTYVLARLGEDDLENWHNHSHTSEVKYEYNGNQVTYAGDREEGMVPDELKVGADTHVQDYTVHLLTLLTLRSYYQKETSKAPLDKSTLDQATNITTLLTALSRLPLTKLVREGEPKTLVSFFAQLDNEQKERYPLLTRSEFSQFLVLLEGQGAKYSSEDLTDYEGGGKSDVASKFQENKGNDLFRNIFQSVFAVTLSILENDLFIDKIKRKVSDVKPLLDILEDLTGLDEEDLTEALDLIQTIGFMEANKPAPKPQLKR